MANRQATEHRTQRIEALIRPYELDELVDALEGAGHEGLILTEVTGFFPEANHLCVHRGQSYATERARCLTVEVVVAPALAPRVVQILESQLARSSATDRGMLVREVLEVREPAAGSSLAVTVSSRYQEQE